MLRKNNIIHSGTLSGLISSTIDSDIVVLESSEPVRDFYNALTFLHGSASTPEELEDRCSFLKQFFPTAENFEDNRKLIYFILSRIEKTWFYNC